ncbi:hypothetical protein [Treponema brennaborense]|uniref:Uncharacterized protein n=1 Tax=Treponema brennaborense (strain DSM 12168 / CIP 105900 / DD5/3) TaxID=906968 RepID=F4LNR2_TREBD|nr:hypothetical protein [Treponema brennaborense]AEE16897.1 hypothetical protein Trebr_1473 [Treponema brennaborense DSM 12168]
MVKSILKRSGFSKCRYVFTGYQLETGEIASFFIELDILNPAVSPETVQSNLCTVAAVSDPSLYASAASTPAAVPSYFVIRAGMYGSGGCRFESFNPTGLLTVSKKELRLSCGSCTFGYTESAGSVSDPVAGTMSWNLRMEKNTDRVPVTLQRDVKWNVVGMRTVFSGSVTVNGAEWIVKPSLSNGYSDLLWGKNYPEPFFHLSGSRLQSLISGKLLENSSFAVQGVCAGTAAVFADFETDDRVQRVSYVQKREKVRFNCTTVDSNVHWTVSAENKNFLLDIDVYCDAAQMMLRKYELPFASTAELHVLGGGAGIGEIKLYRRGRKNLELIEYAKLEHAFCEYGSIDTAP